MLAPALSQSGQDFLCIQVDKTRLVIAWSMEDQMGKAQFNVRADLLDVLFWIRRYQPATVRLICYLFCPALHLARIVNIGLLFRCKRQARPDACVTQCPLTF